MIHTPGPWKRGHGAIVAPTTDQDGDPIIIALPYGTSKRVGLKGVDEFSTPPKDAADANARLIVSAPDLLQALEAVEKLFATPGYYIGTRDGADPLAIDATMLLVAQAVRAAKGGA